MSENETAQDEVVQMVLRVKPAVRKAAKALAKRSKTTMSDYVASLVVQEVRRIKNKE
jgi:hypothetical protein